MALPELGQGPPARSPPHQQCPLGLLEAPGRRHQLLQEPTPGDRDKVVSSTFPAPAPTARPPTASPGLCPPHQAVPPGPQLRWAPRLPQHTLHLQRPLPQQAPEQLQHRTQDTGLRAQGATLAQPPSAAPLGGAGAQSPQSMVRGSAGRPFAAALAYSPERTWGTQGAPAWACPAHSVPPAPAAGQPPPWRRGPGVPARPAAPPCRLASCEARPGAPGTPAAEAHRVPRLSPASHSPQAAPPHQAWPAGPHLHALRHHHLCHHRFRHLGHLGHLHGPGAPAGPGGPGWGWALGSCWRGGAPSSPVPALPQAAQPRGPVSHEQPAGTGTRRVVCSGRAGGPQQGGAGSPWSPGHLCPWPSPGHQRPRRSGCQPRTLFLALSPASRLFPGRRVPSRSHEGGGGAGEGAPGGPELLTPPPRSPAQWRGAGAPHPQARPAHPHCCRPGMGGNGGSARALGSPWGWLSELGAQDHPWFSASSSAARDPPQPEPRAPGLPPTTWPPPASPPPLATPPRGPDTLPRLPGTHTCWHTLATPTPTLPRRSRPSPSQLPLLPGLLHEGRGPVGRGTPRSLQVPWSRGFLMRPGDQAGGHADPPPHPLADSFVQHGSGSCVPQASRAGSQSLPGVPLPRRGALPLGGPEGRTGPHR